MVNLFIKFWRWLTNTSQIHTFPLKEDLIERDETVRELTKKLQSYDAQLSNISAQEKAKQELMKNVDERKLIISRLLNEKRKINEKKYGGTFSFKVFYRKLLKDKKFRRGLEICDKDDSVVLAKFGDFVVFPDGNFGIIDSQGTPIAHGRTLREIIYKPESISNQMRRRRILLPCDKNFNATPDIEEVELPECTYNEQTGKIRWAKRSIQPLKQLIIDREKRMVEDSKYIERLEKTKAEISRKNKKLERKVNILENNKDTTETELSKSTNLQKEYYKKIGDLQKKIETLSSSKESLEDIRRKLEHVNKRLIEKVEEVGMQTQFRRVLGTVQNLVEWSKIQTGDTIVQPRDENETAQQTKPGEVVR